MSIGETFRISSLLKIEGRGLNFATISLLSDLLDPKYHHNYKNKDIEEQIKNSVLFRSMFNQDKPQRIPININDSPIRCIEFVFSGGGNIKILSKIYTEEDLVSTSEIRNIIRYQRIKWKDHIHCFLMR